LGPGAALTGAGSPDPDALNTVVAVVVVGALVVVDVVVVASVGLNLQAENLLEPFL